MLNTKLLGSVSAGPSEFVEDVFSTYLYTGNGSTQTITNGIDLAGEGGLVWIKDRNSGAKGHALFDTVRGGDYKLQSQSTTNASSVSQQITSFNSNGFTLGTNSDINSSPTLFCSWTFRKAPKFFDVVTYTGDGAGNRTISHSLGSTPGMIVLRAFTSASSWWVYHRSLASKNMLFLNLTSQAVDYSPDTMVGNPTSTTFDVSSSFNSSGETYVAYLFAHDAGGFGAAGTDNVISCGSFTTDGSSNATINLGYEPQYVLLKPAGDVGNWDVMDVMRGFSQTSISRLQPNTSSAEGTVAGNYIFPTATGFQLANGFYGLPSTQYIYMAIRRPMKPPTSGTQVFSPELTSVRGSFLTAPTAPDMVFSFNRNFDTPSGNTLSYSRLTGAKLLTSSTTAESSRNSNSFTDSMFFYQDFTSSPMVHYAIKRATGFFDVVCYTGTGSARTVTHNLGAVPELMIVKRRSGSGAAWTIYSAALGATKYLEFNTAAADTFSFIWNDTAPTSSVFTVGTTSGVNTSSETYVAYLFATLAGVSKVFSFTGNGSSQTINCGFTAGARLVLIKRTDSTGDWYIWDTARGIVSGNDPHLSLNTTAAEVTSNDSIDPDNSGFIVNQLSATNINVSSATYIGIAIS